MRELLPFVLLLALGCSQGPHTSDPKATPPATKEPTSALAPTPNGPVKLDLDIPVNGLSGLAASGDRLWSVSERGNSLVSIDGKGAARVIPIGELPVGYDLESVAALSDGRLALGTETSAQKWKSKEGQSLAKILLVAIDDGARVDGSIDLPFSLWGVNPAENQGIEGLCSAHGRLIAGLETTIEREGKRFAPLAIHDGKAWLPFLVELTSEQGKLSSLDCRERGDNIEVLAVERHFGIMRVLHFESARAPAATVVPRVLADLTSFTANGNINIEGIAWYRDGLAMVVDNEWKTITGPNQVIFAPLPL